MTNTKKIIALLICAMLTFGITVPASADETAAKVTSSGTAAVNDTYLEYYSAHANDAKHYGFLPLEYTGSENPSGTAVTAESKNGFLLDPAVNNWVEYSVNADSDGLYYIRVNYRAPSTSSNKSIIVSMLLDGSLPYEKAKTFLLPRIFEDAIDENGKTVTQDNQGNDLRPTQLNVETWTASEFANEQGLYSEPYMVYLTAGVHKLRFTIEEEIIILGEISVGYEPQSPKYSDYISKYSDADYADGDATVIQAENAYRKNDAMLYATYDRTTTQVTPYDPACVKLNTIGKENWAHNGEWISWKAPVEKAGLYRIAFHANQDFNQSISSYRKLLINGELPFAEADNITFTYDTSWYMKVLGDETPMYVYLEPGDEISLSCVPGKLSDVLRSIQYTVLNLNKIYRSIIGITSTTPDIYQDYDLAEKIPTLESDLKENQQQLDKIYEMVKKVLGTSGGNASTIKQVSQIIGELADDPFSIPDRIGSFKSEIENLGSLILSLQNQPLELDFIAFVPKDAEVPDGKSSFSEALSYGFQKFFHSFITDYNSYSAVNGENGKKLNVWVSTGRDQLQILSNMINNKFSSQTGIAINLSLIDTGNTMIQATLAGKGPDVALMINKDLPVNLAMRGALVDLKDYDFSTLRSQTGESAWKSFYYNGGLYALPESESYDVLFYRTDIYKELGLDAPPDTWDEFYDQMEIIQKNNFSVGLLEIDAANYGVSAGIVIYNMLLYQNGGRYYNDKLTATEFESDEAYKAFTTWVSLYDKFGLDRSFSFYNVFRSGEMPIGIAGYGTYNQLVAAAPEIAGLWSFAPIPGTKKADGTIDRTQTTNVTGSIVLNTAKKHGVVDEAVEFITWWTSADMQTQYGKELEATLGVAARYAPANRVALQNLGWTKSELNVLNESAKWTTNMEQIPGNYVVPRSLTSAARSAISGKQTIRRALILYNLDINAEITRKRAEFGLDG